VVAPLRQQVLGQAAAAPGGSQHGASSASYKAWVIGSPQARRSTCGTERARMFATGPSGRALRNLAYRACQGLSAVSVHSTRPACRQRSRWSASLGAYSSRVSPGMFPPSGSSLVRRVATGKKAAESPN
jgi:hypothetical protein